MREGERDKNRDTGETETERDRETLAFICLCGVSAVNRDLSAAGIQRSRSHNLQQA